MIVQQGLNHPSQRSIVLANEQWHTGLIGIVASKINDRFYRPTILINTSNEIAQGSGRSIVGFDILKAITACSEHLNSFGGHKMAIGITIKPEKIQEFIYEFELYARDNLNFLRNVTSRS